jgi:hypothetical protein
MSPDDAGRWRLAADGAARWPLRAGTKIFLLSLVSAGEARRRERLIQFALHLTAGWIGLWTLTIESGCRHQAADVAMSSDIGRHQRSGAGADWHRAGCRPSASLRKLNALSDGGKMEELNGRMLACQILITGLIARVANESSDPLRFLTDFRDEIRAVVGQVRIAGGENPDRVRQSAQRAVDELFSLMKPPSSDWGPISGSSAGLAEREAAGNRCFLLPSFDEYSRGGAGRDGRKRRSRSDPAVQAQRRWIRIASWE